VPSGLPVICVIWGLTLSRGACRGAFLRIPMRVVGKDTTHLKRVTCPECMSIIEYAINETREFNRSDYGGSGGVWRELTCPACDFRIQVE
jgi:hypothetical protein